MPDPTDFQVHVVTSLGELHEGQKHIIHRLDTMNGTMSTLFRLHGENKDAIIRHATECPMREDIVEIRRELSTGDHPGSKAVQIELERFQQMEARVRGSKEASERWLKWLRPAILLIGFIVLVLILVHAKELLHYLKIF
jgi:hypothetical protein